MGIHDFVVVIGSADPGGPIHIGKLKIRILQDPSNPMDNPGTSRSTLRWWGRLAVLEDSDSALWCLCRAPSFCQIGCNHPNAAIDPNGSVRLTGPNWALISAKVVHWGRTILDYTDPSNPELGKIPYLEAAYRRDRDSGENALAKNVLEHITDIYRQSLGATRTRIPGFWSG